MHSTGRIDAREAGGPAARRLSNAPLRTVVVLVFLALQWALVAHGLTLESRDFSWAPHTSQVSYALRVDVAGRVLTSSELAARYGVMGSEGWEAHSYRNLINLISQYERTYGRHDGARVRLEYRVNGGELQVWELPAP